MILDTLKNKDIYTNLHPALAKGLEYLATTDFSKLEMGTYKIEGDTIFAILQSYDTKDEKECRLESHQKYVDIQYMVSGEEYVGVVPLDNQKITENLLKENDVVFYEGVGERLKLSGGSFMIFYPTDVHAPCIHVNHPEKVIKVVVKVAV